MDLVIVLVMDTGGRFLSNIWEAKTYNSTASRSETGVQICVL